MRTTSTNLNDHDRTRQGGNRKWHKDANTLRAVRDGAAACGERMLWTFVCGVALGHGSCLPGTLSLAGWSSFAAWWVSVTAARRTVSTRTPPHQAERLDQRGTRTFSAMQRSAFAAWWVSVTDAAERLRHERRPTKPKDCGHPVGVRDRSLAGWPPVSAWWGGVRGRRASR